MPPPLPISDILRLNYPLEGHLEQCVELRKILVVVLVSLCRKSKEAVQTPH